MVEIDSQRNSFMTFALCIFSRKGYIFNINNSIFVSRVSFMAPPSRCCHGMSCRM